MPAGTTLSVHSVVDWETFHPGIGPAAEAEALYVRQLQLPDRVCRCAGHFVIWDVGLGAAANAVVSIRSIASQTEGLSSTRQLRLISFDRTIAATEFALNHSRELGYFHELAVSVQELISNLETRIRLPGLEVHWTLNLGEFRAVLEQRNQSPRQSAEAPDAILFDPHSPARNPDMWTVELFSSLFAALEPERACVLATFTRSTRARVAMVLGGFHVGAGRASGLKEETTIASTRLAELEQPLDERWLERARRSPNAEPLRVGNYRSAPLAPETWHRLRRAPQFWAALGSDL